MTDSFYLMETEWHKYIHILFYSVINILLRTIVANL